MKTKIKLLSLLVVGLGLSVATYATCLDSSSDPKGKCTQSGCSAQNETGPACNGNTCAGC